MTTSTVLVTGGAGFIGSHVGERFARGGFAVRVLDDLSSGDEANCAPDWKLIRADVRDGDAVARAVEGCSVVVHLAAFTSVPASFEHFEHCYSTNVEGTHNVLAASAAAGVAKLVFASSSAVYADLPEAPKSEADCPDPISPYAVSKLEGEHLLEIFRKTQGLPSVALRFFNVYGPRQAANSAYAAAIPIFIERALDAEALLVNGDGLQTRDFVFVGDVADVVFTAGTRPECGVLNVGTGRPLSVLELADTVVKLTGSSAAHEHQERRAGDVRSSTAEIDRVRDALGWSPQCRLEDGLDATLAWYRARRERV